MWLEVRVQECGHITCMSGFAVSTGHSLQHARRRGRWRMAVRVEVMDIFCHLVWVTLDISIDDVVFAVKDKRSDRSLTVAFVSD